MRPLFFFDHVPSHVRAAHQLVAARAAPTSAMDGNATRLAAPLDPLHELHAAFLVEARGSSLSDVRQVQPAPHGSIAYGAAGLASVLLHHGERDEAARWLAVVQ